VLSSSRGKRSELLEAKRNISTFGKANAAEKDDVEIQHFAVAIANQVQ
jgi:hypothetical protein